MNASEHASRIHNAAATLNQAIMEAQDSIPDLLVEMRVSEQPGRTGRLPWLAVSVKLELK